MKKILFLLLLSTKCFAADHYWSTSGSNANNGLSSAAPKQTIAQLVSDMSSYAASDNIYFKRGDVFYGDVYGIIIKRSSLNFDAYGTGANPIISGLTTIGSGTWVSVGKNLYEASVTNVKASVNLVLRNSKIQQVGRYPNPDNGTKGYLNYTTGTTTSLSGVVNSSITNWTGAEVVVRPNRYSIYHTPITSHSGTSINFSALLFNPTANYGYFFQRDSRTLDQDGEWWFDAINNKLRVYSTSAPSTYNYQISTVDSLISNHGKYYGSISIKNIDFTGANAVGIEAYSCTGYIVQNCNFTNMGAQGIDFNFNSSSTVDNCTFKNTLGTAIRMYNNNSPNYLTITNNNIDSTALVAGMEYQSNYYGGNGIINKGNNTTTTGNTVKHSGYIGIEWGMGSNIVVAYNFVDSFCLSRDDGGGAYTYQGRGSLPYYYNRVFKKNIITNGFGQNYGTNNLTGTPVNGAYFDEGTHNIIIDSNTIANVPGSAIFGNSNDSLFIRANTLVNDKGKALGIQRLSQSKLIRQIVATKNIYYPYKFEYRNLMLDNPSLLTGEQDIAAFGTLDSNYYSLETVDTSLSIVSTWANRSNYRETYFSFSYLTGTIGVETHSTSVIGTGLLQYNASYAPKLYTFYGLSKKDIYGNIFNNLVIIPAWGSIILIENGKLLRN